MAGFQAMMCICSGLNFKHYTLKDHCPKGLSIPCREMAWHDMVFTCQASHPLPRNGMAWHGVHMVPTLSLQGTLSFHCFTIHWDCEQIARKHTFGWNKYWSSDSFQASRNKAYKEYRTWMTGPVKLFEINFQFHVSLIWWYFFSICKFSWSSDVSFDIIFASLYSFFSDTKTNTSNRNKAEMVFR